MKIRSQRAFIGVTLTTVLGIASVLIVYAAILGSRTGLEVTVGGVSGDVLYSEAQGGPWTATLGPLTPAGTAWYAILQTPGSEYVGPVSISWLLQKKGSDPDWSDPTDVGSPAFSTSIVLTAAGQMIYVEPNGVNSLANFNWGQAGFGDATGSYRIIATISSTG